MSRFHCGLREPKPEQQTNPSSISEPSGESPPHGDPASNNPSSPSGDSPPLIRALLPITIPVILIAVGSLTDYLVKQNVDSTESAVWTDILRGMGNKNIALGIGAVLALSLRKFCPEEQRGTLVTRSLASAGNIILITAAGGAFGVMLKQAGIGPAVESLTGAVPGLLLLPLAFCGDRCRSHTAGIGDCRDDHCCGHSARLRQCRITALSSGLHRNGDWCGQQADFMDDGQCLLGHHENERHDRI